MDDITYFKDFFTHFGAQATTLVIAYMVLKTSIYGFVLFGVNQSIKALVKLCGTDVSKSKLEEIKRDHKREIESIEAMYRSALKDAETKRRELERLIHINKCMKEAKDASITTSNDGQ